MRKTSAVLASLSLAALALTGCTAAPTFAGESCDRTDRGNGVENAVTVEGDFGSKPDVEVFSPVRVQSTSYTDLITGDGRAIVNGDQAMMIELSIFSGDTGERVFGTSYDATKGNVSNIDYWASQSPGLVDAMQCATEGSRILAALTPEDFGTDALKGLGLDADDTMIFVIDVVQAFLPQAEGSLQFNDARGLPTVVRAPDGTPGVIIPDTAAPTERVVQTLIKGEGEIFDGTTIPLVNVTVVGWDDKKVVSSTWGQGPSADLASTAPSVAQALLGQPVGSQVLVVTPAGEMGPAAAYVVDILGAVTAPTP